MVSRSLVLVAVIVLALVASGAYYSQNANFSNPANSQEVDIQIIGDPSALTTDHYSPGNFTVPQGEQVMLVVLNTDDNTHGLVIPQFKVDTGIIPPGKTVRVSFVADKTGTFQFYEPPGYCGGGVGNVCNSLQHMTGNMTVIP